MLEPHSKTTRGERKAKFRKLGEALTALDREWRDHLGDHQFEIRPRAAQDRELSSTLFGPTLKTQQFERTVRRGA